MEDVEEAEAEEPLITLFFMLPVRTRYSGLGLRKVCSNYFATMI